MIIAGIILTVYCISERQWQLAGIGIGIGFFGAIAMHVFGRDLSVDADQIENQ
tara:strand:- start:149 stop:307 length:159 start_codon:yes stop_codon:yes gene_type:complete